MITKVFHVTITLIKYWYIDCVYYIIYKHILSIMQWYIFYYIKCNISQELLFQAECHFLLRDYINSAAAAKSRQSCPTLCDPIDGSPPGSPVPGILQARTLEWVAISFSNAWKRKVKVKSLSRVWLFATPWTLAHQAPPSMGFSRQEYWSGVPFDYYLPLRNDIALWTNKSGQNFPIFHGAGLVENILNWHRYFSMDFILI